MNLFTKQKRTHSLREWTSGCPGEEGGKGIVSVGLMCAAAVKLLQSCPTLRPHRRQPTRLLCPWDSPGKNTGVGCHFLLQYMRVKSESEVAQSCPTLSDPMDCSLPGSSIHGIFQARVLEWGAIAFSGIDVYTLLFLKWITNKDLLYSARNTAYCYVGAWMGGEFGGEWIHVYVWLSPCTAHLKLSQCC